MTQQTRLVSFVLVALIASACSDGSSMPSDAALPNDAGPPGDAGTSAEVDQFLSQLASSVCSSFRQCAYTEVIFEQQAGSEARCRSHLEARHAPLSRVVASGRARFEASQVAGCLAAVDAAVCEQGLPNGLEDWPAECRAVIAGQLVPMAACGMDVECAGGECVCGTCRAFAAVGQSCTEAPCAPGLRCAPAGMLCEAAPALPSRGQPCTSECAGGLRCVSGTCRSGRDLRTQLEGQSCDNESSLCATGLECDFGGGNVCRPPLAAGAACDEALAVSLCPEGTTCHGPAGTATCAAPLAEGAECYGSGRADPCAPGLWCAFGTSRCTRVGALGEACTQADDCYSGVCRAGVCSHGDDAFCP